MNPVLNGHGLPEYYQKFGQTYKKGDPVYDIDGDYVRYKYDDLLSAYNSASYSINNQIDMKDVGEEENTTDDKKLYHRQGESCRRPGGERAGRHGEEGIPDGESPIGEREEELLQPAIDEGQNGRHVVCPPPTKMMR